MALSSNAKSNVHTIGVVLLTMALFAGTATTALAQASWPKVDIPKDIDTFDIGEQVTANGLPMRMRGFLSAAAPARLAIQFRQTLGQPLVENALGTKLVLGRALGQHYLTVQLEPAGSGTRGVVALASLGAAKRADDQRLLSLFPGGSSLLGRTVSIDGRTRADHAVLANGHSPELNSKYVADMLLARGYVLEREAPPRKPTTLYFKRPGGEAMAMIFRNADGRTAVVFNTVDTAESAK